MRFSRREYWSGEEVSRHLYMALIASTWPLSFLVGPTPFRCSVARGRGHELSTGFGWGVVWHQVPQPSRLPTRPAPSCLAAGGGSGQFGKMMLLSVHPASSHAWTWNPPHPTPMLPWLSPALFSEFILCPMPAQKLLNPASLLPLLWD